MLRQWHPQGQRRGRLDCTTTLREVAVANSRAEQEIVLHFLADSEIGCRANGENGLDVGPVRERLECFLLLNNTSFCAFANAFALFCTNGCGQVVKWIGSLVWKLRACISRATRDCSL